MPGNPENKVSPWLLPGTILGGILLLIGGITTGSLSTVVVAFAATGVLLWTILSRGRAG